MWPNPQFPVNLVTFTEGIINGKLHFCAVWSNILFAVVRLTYSLSTPLTLFCISNSTDELRKNSCIYMYHMRKTDSDFFNEIPIKMSSRGCFFLILQDLELSVLLKPIYSSNILWILSEIFETFLQLLKVCGHSKIR